MTDTCIQHLPAELCKERVALRDAVRQARETVDSLIRANGHKLVLDLPERELWLDADVPRLCETFAALLRNAAQYTRPGGYIWLEAAKEAGSVKITVRDTGTGIPAPMLTQIAALFAGKAAPLPPTQQVTGLMQAKACIDLHGGTLAAHSEGVDQGSEFIVRLPLAASTPPSGTLQAHSLPRARLRVLVVDDNATLAKTLGWMVDALEHDVRIAQDGTTAIATAKSFVPDVVLLDLGMPGMSGYDICRHMREDPALRHTVFAAQTGWGQQEHRQRSKEAGFAQHFVKPLRMETLKTFLSQLLPHTP